MPTVTLRFFAAARAVAGTGERQVSVADPASIRAALDAARSEASDYEEVVDRCSFLVNAVAATDREQLIDDGDVVDVLPPFAGG